MKTAKPTQAEAQMQIRKPIAEVYQAFIDPAITKNFWFNKSTGKLELGQPVTWEWTMYNLATKVVPTILEPCRKIAIDWYLDQTPTQVEFNFQSLSDGSTFVYIIHSGFNKTGDELIEAIKDSTGGFTTVLDGLKSYLEHQLNLNLIADKFPREMMQHGNN